MTYNGTGVDNSGGVVQNRLITIANALVDTPVTAGRECRGDGDEGDVSGDPEKP